MFQVTNEDTYMDFAVSLFQNVINTANDAKIKNDGFLGWIDSTIGITNGVRVNDGTEVSLAEGRGMRTVARMLWVLSKSPEYLNKGNNRQQYNEMLDWFQEHGFYMELLVKKNTEKYILVGVQVYIAVNSPECLCEVN